MITPMNFLLADKNTVEGFLRETPEDEIIERNSWMGRLAAINEEIAQLEMHPAPKRVNLTYRGAPVVGTEGVASTFGLQATRAYTNAVQFVGAQWYRSEPLKESGNVPNAKQLDPLIVGVAHGSFGFQLQEPEEQQLTIEGKSVVALALAKTQQLLESTLGTDDELTEAVNDVDARAIRKLRTFLEVLRRNNALFAIESESGTLKFEQPAQVVRSLSRLEERNIHREEVTLVGAFAGVLPAARDFEFKREDGEIIKGKISRDIGDERVAAFNEMLGQQVKLRALSTRVGQGKARFVLVGE